MISWNDIFQLIVFTFISWKHEAWRLINAGCSTGNDESSLHRTLNAETAWRIDNGGQRSLLKVLWWMRISLLGNRKFWKAVTGVTSSSPKRASPSNTSILNPKRFMSYTVVYNWKRRKKGGRKKNAAMRIILKLLRKREVRFCLDLCTPFFRVLFLLFKFSS